MKKTILMILSFSILGLSSACFAHTHRLKLIVVNKTNQVLVFKNVEYGPPDLVASKQTRHHGAPGKNHRDVYIIHVHKHYYHHKSQVDTQPMSIKVKYDIDTNTGAETSCELKAKRSGYTHEIQFKHNIYQKFWVTQYQHPKGRYYGCGSFSIKDSEQHGDTIKFILNKP